MKLNQQLKIKGRVWIIKKDAITGKIKEIKEYDNLVVTIGRSVVAQRLAGIFTYTGEINYGALGNSIIAPTNSDIKLGNELFRKPVASATYSNNIAYLSFFYTAAEVSGTFKEFGTFIDGTITPDSGQMFTRVLIDITKSTTETLTIDVTYTIS